MPTPSLRCAPECSRAFVTQMANKSVVTLSLLVFIVASVNATTTTVFTATRGTVTPSSCAVTDPNNQYYCAYSCSAGYTITTDGTTNTYTSTSTVSGCTCATGTGPSGLAGTVSFSDGATATISNVNGCNLNVVTSIGGTTCTAPYTGSNPGPLFTCSTSGVNMLKPIGTMVAVGAVGTLALLA